MSNIAIFSDIHFGKFSRTKELVVPGEIPEDNNDGEAPLVEGLISELKKENVTHILIAGDLTSIGKPQEFHFCWEKIKDIARDTNVLMKNVVCCLGNHDVDWDVISTSKNVVKQSNNEDVKTIIEEKYQKLAAYVGPISVPEMKGVFLKEKEQFPCTGVVEFEDFIVFVLNTGWNSGTNQEYQHGKLSKEQLEWLKTESDYYRKDNRIKIILMHHHPYNYSYPVSRPDISTMEEGSEIVEIALQNEISIIIHGHRHHPIVKTIHDNGYEPITFICAGSLSVNSKHRDNGDIPNTMHILKIEKDKDYYELINYEYKGSDGWNLVKYSLETPIDARMKIGKVFSREEQKRQLRDILQTEEKSIEYEHLPESLQFMLYSDLNDLVKECFEADYYIFGEFPQKVCFQKKENYD